MSIFVCEVCRTTAPSREKAVEHGWQSEPDAFWFWHHYCRTCFAARNVAVQESQP